jgi:hypothetical protein
VPTLLAGAMDQAALAEIRRTARDSRDAPARLCGGAAPRAEGRRHRGPVGTHRTVVLTIGDLPKTGSHILAAFLAIPCRARCAVCYRLQGGSRPIRLVSLERVQQVNVHATIFLDFGN